MNKIIDKLPRRIVFSALIIILAAALPASAGRVEIPEELQIRVRFDSTMVISSKNLSPGLPLLIYLVDPIEIGEVVIIEKDAPGTALVTEVEKAGKGGKPGRIKVEFTELEPHGEYYSADSAKIKIAGSVESAGKGKKLLSYLFIAGLFIKGSEAAIKTDSIYTVTVTESILLESE